MRPSRSDTYSASGIKKLCLPDMCCKFSSIVLLMKEQNKHSSMPKPSSLPKLSTDSTSLSVSVSQTEMITGLNGL